MSKGIWKHLGLIDSKVLPAYELSLNEGNTPLESNAKLAKALNLKSIYLKREDLNPGGSHKDRYIAFTLSAHISDIINENPETKNDYINFVISSSGNAAISSIRYINSENDIRLKLYVFISSSLHKSKLERMIAELPELKDQLIKYKNCDNGKINIKFSQSPLSDSIKFANKLNATLLRGSNDKYGTNGLRTISKEILSQLKDLPIEMIESTDDTETSNLTNKNIEDVFPDSIFIPCSSGTLFTGIAEGFAKLETKVRLIALQTSEVNAIAKTYDKNFTSEQTSIAEAIVDRVAHRKTEIQKIIKDTDGTAFVLQNSEIEYAQKLLKKNGIITSNESAMCIAGIIKAKATGLIIERPVCILTGTA
jgi:threonine synthase